jgi:outer membrane protein assembly factor BamB
MILSSLIYSGLLCATALAGDWPQFLGPQRDGTATSEAVIAPFPPAGPKVVWSKSVGQGFSGPAVVGGKLVLFHRIDDKEVVECMDTKTGATLWSAGDPTHYQDDFGFDEGPRATPTIDKDRIFTFGAEGTLTCRELGSGKTVWQVDTKAQYTAGKGYFGLACSPLIDGDAVILNIGGGPGAGIVSFDKSTGKLLWKTSDDEASYSSPTSATINGQRYLLVFDREGLVALEPATGKTRSQLHWRSRSAASVNAATPIVMNDQIFISASYGTGAALLKFKEPAPETIWSGDDILSNHYATSVYHAGFLYGFDGRTEGGPNFRCVEFATGKVRWSQDNFGAGTVLSVGDQLLIMTEKGELILAAATPDGFKRISRAQILPFQVRAYGALADGHFYARSKDKLVCVDLRGGSK